MNFTQRSVTTFSAALVILCFLAVGVSNYATAGEAVAVPITEAINDCAGSDASALLVERWTPVRNLITKSKLRRAARSAARASCSAPQEEVTILPLRIISVAPVRLFRGCVTNKCR